MIANLEAFLSILLVFGALVGVVTYFVLDLSETARNKPLMRFIRGTAEQEWTKMMRSTVGVVLLVLCTLPLGAQVKRKQPPGAAPTGKIHVDSTPEGGEISIDGKFYGNTPSDLVLPTGAYQFKISLHGLEWTRLVQVTPGDITLQADMSQKSVKKVETDDANSNSQWGDSQPAVDSLHAIAQKIQSCPPELVYSSQWGKKPSELEKITARPSENVTWDVVRVGSARSPYSGFIELEILLSHEVLPLDSDQALKLDERWLQQRKLGIWLDTEYRYEFDVGPEGLELAKTLSRQEGEGAWKASELPARCWGERAIRSQTIPTKGSR